MNEGTAIELARRKMHELGVGDDYTLRYRKIQLAPIRKVELEAYNELILVVTPSYHLKVYSKAGILNLRDKKINEHQYIHRGKTWLINQSGKHHINVTLLQVIPTIQQQYGRDNK